MDKIKNILGFGDEPARLWAWGGIIIALVLSIVLFFLGYSLNRHKKMVYRLTLQVKSQEAELKVRDIRLKKKDKELELALIKTEDKENHKKRKNLRKRIENDDESLSRAKRELKKSRGKIKSKDTDKLLKEAIQLTKDTL